MSAKRISTPPMVGVPFFETRWVCGPSLRMGCPSRCFFLSQAMMDGPSAKLSKSDVTTAPPERNVK